MIVRQFARLAFSATINYFSEMCMSKDTIPRTVPFFAVAWEKRTSIEHDIFQQDLAVRELMQDFRNLQNMKSSPVQIGSAMGIANMPSFWYRTIST